MVQKAKLLLNSNTKFIITIELILILCGLVFNKPTLAMWLGFMLAGYSAVANDSIQTLGTFLSSNKKVDWRILWVFLGSILAITILYGWNINAGDISYGRLNKIPEQEAISYLQLITPVVLIVLTRLRMPVSTTFLILATFSSSSTISGMLSKTMLGYVLAFVVSMIVWGALSLYLKRRGRTSLETKLTSKQEKRWRILQWASTAFLWSAWLVQDNANAAVFLPRSLSGMQVAGAVTFMVIALGYILYRRGGEIQQIVTEKTDVLFVKSATLIDFVYGCILVYFKWLNDLPMSTTWVFLGLLAGREIVLTIILSKEKTYKRTLKLVQNDLLGAGFGLGVSLALAIIVNNQL